MDHARPSEKVESVVCNSLSDENHLEKAESPKYEVFSYQKDLEGQVNVAKEPTSENSRLKILEKEKEVCLVVHYRGLKLGMVRNAFEGSEWQMMMME